MEINLDNPKIKECIKTFNHKGRFTNEQAMFSIYLLQGLSTTEAFFQAYGNPYNLTRKELAQRASKAKNNTNIKLFIEHVRDTVKELENIKNVFEGVMSVEDRRIFLSQVIGGKIKNEIINKSGDIIEIEASIETKLKSVDLLNKMDLLYSDNSKDTVADIVVNVTQSTTSMESILEDPEKEEELIEPVPDLPEIKPLEIEIDDEDD